MQSCWIFFAVCFILCGNVQLERRRNLQPLPFRKGEDDKYYRAAYVYYTDSFCKVLENENELQTFLDQPDLSLVVMREKQYTRLSDALKAKTHLIFQDHIGNRAMVLISNGIE